MPSTLAGDRRVDVEQRARLIGHRLIDRGACYDIRPKISGGLAPGCPLPFGILAPSFDLGRVGGCPRLCFLRLLKCW
jgi:hypothetical protein